MEKGEQPIDLAEVRKRTRDSRSDILNCIKMIQKSFDKMYDLQEKDHEFSDTETELFDRLSYIEKVLRCLVKEPNKLKGKNNEQRSNTI